MKLRKISDIRPTLGFTEYDFLEKYRESFKLSELGRIQAEPDRQTGTRFERVGADTIYANNPNRAYCTENRIITNFVRKGPKQKDEDTQVSSTRRIIGKLSATVMEVSFGNQKQHFTLARVAARNQWSETLMIFFGIHMANAATLAARKLAQELKQREKRRRRA